jgi:hypothetical protein
VMDRVKALYRDLLGLKAGADAAPGRLI